MTHCASPRCTMSTKLTILSICKLTIDNHDLDNYADVDINNIIINELQQAFMDILAISGRIVNHMHGYDIGNPQAILTSDETYDMISLLRVISYYSNNTEKLAWEKQLLEIYPALEDFMPPEMSKTALENHQMFNGTTNDSD